MSSDVEAKFPPRPGGLVDSARNQAAKDTTQAIAHQEALAAAIDPEDYVPVKVHTVEPEVLGARTVSVSTGTNAVRQILGTDRQRKRAVIMTLDEPVVIASSRTGADDNRNSSNAAGQSAGGFVLPVNVPLVIESRGAAWVAATSATATRVSVWTESYEAE